MENWPDIKTIEKRLEPLLQQEALLKKNILNIKHEINRISNLLMDDRHIVDLKEYYDADCKKLYTLQQQIYLWQCMIMLTEMKSEKKKPIMN